MASVFEQVRAVSADVFQVPASQITANSSPETVQTWDSLQHLNLVLALEQQFDVQFVPEEIEKMKNIAAVAELLETKMAK
jgi:acyl carrier protein